MLIIVGGQVSAKESAIHLIDVTHAKGPFADSFSLRFDSKGQEPIINYMPSVDDYKEEGYVEEAIEAFENVVEDVKNFISPDSRTKTLNFFLPLATIKTAKAQKFINQMNVTQAEFYSIQLEATTLPMNGLLCTVTFNPKEIGFQIESFVSTKQEPGITFTFYNRSVLTTIAGHPEQNSIFKMADAGSDTRLVKKKYA